MPGSGYRRLDLVEVQHQGAPIKLFTVPPPSFLVDVAADGQRFVTATFDPRSAHNTLEVVLGWPSLLRRE